MHAPLKETAINKTRCSVAPTIPCSKGAHLETRCHTTIGYSSYDMDGELCTVKAGSQIDAKGLRCVALNFASGESIAFAQIFFDLTLERNARERMNRIRVYSRVRLRCGERQRMPTQRNARPCVVL